MILAQSSVNDPTVGASGWVGAGLLGMVLSWLLLRHLPAKDAQLEKLIESRDALAREMAQRQEKMAADLWASHTAASKMQRDDFRDSLNTVTSHCEKELAGLVAGTKSLHETVTVLREVLEEIRTESGRRKT